MSERHPDGPCDTGLALEKPVELVIPAGHLSGSVEMDHDLDPPSLLGREGTEAVHEDCRDTCHRDVSLPRQVVLEPGVELLGLVTREPRHDRDVAAEAPGESEIMRHHC